MLHKLYAKDPECYGLQISRESAVGTEEKPVKYLDLIQERYNTPLDQTKSHSKEEFREQHFDKEEDLHIHGMVVGTKVTGFRPGVTKTYDPSKPGIDWWNPKPASSSWRNWFKEKLLLRKQKMLGTQASFYEELDLAKETQNPSHKPVVALYMNGEIPLCRSCGYVAEPGRWFEIHKDIKSLNEYNQRVGKAFQCDIGQASELCNFEVLCSCTKHYCMVEELAYAECEDRPVVKSRKRCLAHLLDYSRERGQIFGTGGNPEPCPKRPKLYLSQKYHEEAAVLLSFARGIVSVSQSDLHQALMDMEIGDFVSKFLPGAPAKYTNRLCEYMRQGVTDEVIHLFLGLALIKGSTVPTLRMGDRATEAWCKRAEVVLEFMSKTE